MSHRKKLIILVSLNGQPADFDEINAIAHKHSMPFIEDRAQRFGSEFENKRCCNLTKIGYTSFFSTKPHRIK